MCTWALIGANYLGPVVNSVPHANLPIPDLSNNNLSLNKLVTSHELATFWFVMKPFGIALDLVK